MAGDPETTEPEPQDPDDPEEPEEPAERETTEPERQDPDDPEEPATSDTTATAEPEPDDLSIGAAVGAGLLIAFAVFWAVRRSRKEDDKDGIEHGDTRLEDDADAT